jgi:hypothetical protein
MTRRTLRVIDVETVGHGVRAGPSATPPSSTAISDGFDAVRMPTEVAARISRCDPGSRERPDRRLLARELAAAGVLQAGHAAVASHGRVDPPDLRVANGESCGS